MVTTDPPSSPENIPMLSRPQARTWRSGSTLVEGDVSASERIDSTSSPVYEDLQKQQKPQPPLKTDDTPERVSLLSSKSEGSVDMSYTVHWTDFILPVMTFIMLCWPWIFFGVVWAKGGLQASNHFSKVVKEHPQKANYFITQFATIINLIVGFLFSRAVVWFAQEWMAPKPTVTVFQLSLISAFKNHSFPWGLGDREYLFKQNRWLRVVLVGLCIYAFTNVPGGVTSLLTPIPIYQTATLRGSEFDFAATAPDCLAWLGANPLNNSCDWKNFNGLAYTTCQDENQMGDVLESGRGNFLSLIPNNAESHSFSQLGARNGPQFLGPIRGVLPIGPNGVPAFDTLVQPTPFSDAGIYERMLSYNYTLEHQGIYSNVSCKYDTQTPVKVYPIGGDTSQTALQFNGTCDGLVDVLTNVTQYTTMNSNNSLTFWACKSLPDASQDTSYYIYLHGRGPAGHHNYATAIGDITCTVSPIQPATFPLTYQSTPNIFSSANPITTSKTTFDGYIGQALVAFGGLVAQGQSQQSNLVAESVITFGVKSLGLPAYDNSDAYLRLYELMIQGTLEYQVTYSRLLYSTVPSRPTSCTRALNGLVSYTVLGWSAGSEHIGFLMAMTILNLTSLIIFLAVIYKAHKGGLAKYALDPTDPKVLVRAKCDVEQGVPELGARVEFLPKDVPTTVTPAKVDPSDLDEAEMTTKLISDPK